jgi:sulfur carrier protein ThiS
VQITFKAFATLRDYLPASGDPQARARNEVALEVPEGTPVQEVIDRFHMPRPLVHLVLVNGYYIPPVERAGHVLHDGDALAIWPPIAGG